MALNKEAIHHLNNYYLHGATRPWNVDIYIYPWLIVEVDGSSHVGKQLAKDARKTNDLEHAELPFTVKRYRDHEIWDDLPRILTEIKTLLRQGPQGQIMFNINCNTHV